jgi:hypothetical protein
VAAQLCCQHVLPLSRQPLDISILASEILIQPLRMAPSLVHIQKEPEPRPSSMLVACGFEVVIISHQDGGFCLYFLN